ncbi:MAG: glycosyltransferase [Proteobacteria bacterium]|nr:glycosyltransferase [Pseudomonadota bacterium]
MSSLSIITAIHNGLAMNRLYWKSISENTVAPFELIIIDNHSTDGSEKFFTELEEKTKTKLQRVVYIRNGFNQSYPASQIQGMGFAENEILCFFNNDIWMPKGWEVPFQKLLKQNPLLILSPSGQEAQPTQRRSNELKSKWRRALFTSKIWKGLLFKTEEQYLWMALKIMYGTLDPFKNPTVSDRQTMNGIKGDAVICHRELPETLGPLWDPEIQAADWHLYLKAATLNEKDPSFPLPQVVLGVYIHHFGRYSARMKYEPFPEAIRFKTIEEVWGENRIKRLWWGNFLPQG